MRFLLDHHLSPRRVGQPLQRRGHDVHALASEGSLPDRDVLELAAKEKRVLVTCDARDFAPLTREWAEGERSHSGVVLIRTLENNEHAAIVRGLEQLLAAYPHENQWRDVVLTV